MTGIKGRGQDVTHATPETVVRAGDLVIVAGDRRRVEAFSNRD
ncbi:MAG: TrkA C-terminal domain-containing protein [Tetrasphaera sp.]